MPHNTKYEHIYVCLSIGGTSEREVEAEEGRKSEEGVSEWRACQNLQTIDHAISGRVIQETLRYDMHIYVPHWDRRRGPGRAESPCYRISVTSGTARTFFLAAACRIVVAWKWFLAYSANEKGGTNIKLHLPLCIVLAWETESISSEACKCAVVVLVCWNGAWRLFCFHLVISRRVCNGPKEIEERKLL